MVERTHTLPELSRLADVTPRTVRFYISQGLLPSPGRPGPGAKYDGRHLNRLRLIRRLQREHLPLAEIRGRLRDVSDADVEHLLAEPEPPAASALEYIRRYLPAQVPAPRQASLLRARAAPAAAPIAAAESRVAGAPGGETGSTARSTWERIELTPNIELHVRRPLDREGNRAVDRILQFARETLNND
jgi:DNA-binding transcriptional MerR regulator